MNRAKRQDHLLRYEVPSRSRPDVTHIVELEHYNGNGSCTCEHFYNRLGPILKRGAPSSDDLRCDHIRQARERLIDDLIERVRLNEAKKMKEKR